MFLMLSSSCSKTDTNDPTPSGSTVSDIDGNVYNTVKIGTQTWMVENLKVTKYNDGTSIPNVTDLTAWSNLTTPGYCWYNNDVANKNPYGALYNWYTVNTGKLCPAGWHVSTQNEWITLVTFLGGESIAGGKLKEKGYTHWLQPAAGMTNATNESGFTSLPGGSRNPGLDNFWGIGELGGYWTSNQQDATYAFYFETSYNGNECSYINVGGEPKNTGFSVRCIKD